MSRILTLLLIVMVIASCKQDGKGKVVFKPDTARIHINPVKYPPDSIEETVPDTFQVTELRNMILAFRMGDADYKAQVDTAQGLAQIDADFGYYVNETFSICKEQQLLLDVTESKYIQLPDTLIEVNAAGQYGLIFMDSLGHLQLMQGVYTQYAYIDSINRFFNLRLKVVDDSL